MSKTDKLNLKIVTPEKLAFQEDVEYVKIPGGAGDIGVYNGHSPLVTTLQTGEIVIMDRAAKSVKKTLKTKGGFAEVNTNSCTILSDSID